MTRHRGHRVAVVVAFGLLAALLGSLVTPAFATAVAPGSTLQEPEGEHGASAAQEPEHAAEGEHAEDGEHAGEEHAGPSWLEYGFKWINFVLLIGVLWWLLVTPPAFVVENFEFAGLKVVLAARSEEIVAARDLAQQQIEDAKTRLVESEARLAKVEEEAAALALEAQEDADRERTRLVSDAEAEADKLRQLADRDMGAEVARARRQLRRQVADLSVAIATDLVKDNFSGEDQNRLVREYLDRLGRSTDSRETTR